jgi:YidC/Oxa1 family membrane protein insertase
LFVLDSVIPGHDFGLAIIGLTLLVRIVLWPLVNRQLHSQKVMQQLAPEVARVKKEAKGDRQKETEMLMELYKEKGTSPFAPVVPMLIQLPLLIAFYAVLRDSVKPAELTKLAYPFVQRIGYVSHIITHHAAFSPSLFGLVNLTKPSIVIAALAALAQFYQTWQLRPQTMAAAGEQAQLMGGMTLAFPLITFFIGLRLPSALALYWVTTSLVAAFQQYLVLLRDAHELEEGVVATAPASKPSKPAKGGKRAAKGGVK